MRYNNDHSLCRVHHKVVAIPCVQEALKGQCSCVSLLDKLSATLCWNHIHAVRQPVSCQCATLLLCTSTSCCESSDAVPLPRLYWFTPLPGMPITASVPIIIGWVLNPTASLKQQQQKQ